LGMHYGAFSRSPSPGNCISSGSHYGNMVSATVHSPDCCNKRELNLNLSSLAPPPSSEHLHLFGCLMGVYCNICCSFACKHTPSRKKVDGAIKLFYDASLIMDFCNKDSSAYEMSVRVTLLSHNVQSMCDQVTVSDNRVSYLEFVRENPYSIACFQETRSAPCMKIINNYMCVASGHKNFSFGVEIWICLDPVFECYDNVSGARHRISVDVRSFMTVHSDPRFLVISFSIAGQYYYAANVYAPHIKYGVSYCINFWKQVRHVLFSKVHTFKHLFFVGDFNTKLGGIVNSAVGDFASDKSNAVGRFVSELICELQLTIPATFSGCHDGSDTFTFTHSSGTTHRIDFICIPKTACNVTAGTLDIPTSNAMDHNAVRNNFDISCIRAVSEKQPRFDHLLFEDDDCCRCFEFECRQGTFEMPWLDNSSRLHYFNQYTHTALCGCFPLRVVCRRKPYISDSTRFIILSRKCARAELKRAKHTRAPRFVVMHFAGIFRGWVKKVRKSISSDFKNHLHTSLNVMNASSVNGRWKKSSNSRIVCAPNASLFHLLLCNMITNNTLP
jgi:hypothetical protein